MVILAEQDLLVRILNIPRNHVARDRTVHTISDANNFLYKRQKGNSLLFNLHSWLIPEGITSLYDLQMNLQDRKRVWLTVVGRGSWVEVVGVGVGVDKSRGYKTLVECVQLRWQLHPPLKQIQRPTNLPKERQEEQPPKSPRTWAPPFKIIQPWCTP